MPNDRIAPIFERHCCRSYFPDPILEDDLQLLMEALRWAPSAGNMQPWKFYVIRNVDLKAALAETTYGQTFVKEAPVVFVVCGGAEVSAARYGERGRSFYYLQDTAAAVENLLLAATALGYRSCWVGAFDEAQASKALSLPESLRPVAIVPVGKGNTVEDTTDRKPVEELFVVID